MNLNTITRVMAFSALTLASHLALADDVTNPGNPDSVDFQAAITADKNPCKLTVTPETGTSFAFTYSYAQADADAGELGTMTASGQPATIRASVPSGCSLSAVNIQPTITGGAAKIAKNMAGISTNNGGTFPFFIGLSNVNFYTDALGTTGKAYAVAGKTADNFVASTDTTGTGTLQYGVDNTNSKYGTVNNGYPPLVAQVPGGYMTEDGGYNTEHSGNYGAFFATAGILKMANLNDNPLSPHTGVWNTWYPSEGSGSYQKDTTGKYESVRFTVVSAVSLYPYALTTKTPDPLTVFDSSGGASAPTVTATLTVSTV